MNANDRQPGGTHYKSDYQHWDWWNDTNTDEHGIVHGHALLYAATKYLMRWPAKNGRADVEKALHYVEKVIEADRDQPKAVAWSERRFERFCHKNSVGTHEAMAILLIVQHPTVANLRLARDIIEDIYLNAPVPVLELSMDANDANARTIRDYFKELLTRLWTQREGFSGKRPFGNSGWEHELYEPLITHERLKPIDDEDNIHRPTADKIIQGAIDKL